MALPHMPVLLSRIIRARLSELGRSADEAIARSEIARSTFYSFLNDTRTPQSDTLRKLAFGLDWSAAELQSRLEGIPLVSPVADEQIARIIELLPSIPKDRLHAIEQHVELAVQPVNRGPAKREAARRNKHSDPQPSEKEAHLQQQGENEADDDVIVLYPPRVEHPARLVPGFKQRLAVSGR